ncbi:MULTISPECIES: recombinase family protein [Xanthobacter]|uniref:recombinase family protein n=1 Tax=Xanthobacter TaxID=279 RepID=UPI0035B19221
MLIVVRLDRLARSTRDLLNVLAELSERGVVSGHFPMHGLSIGVEPAPYWSGPFELDSGQASVWTVCRA